MDIDIARYVKKEKTPPHEKAAVVNLFKEFMGDSDFQKKFKTDQDAYKFWLSKVGNCTFGDALDILKSLESLPIEYNKAGTIVNKLKEYGKRK